MKHYSDFKYFCEKHFDYDIEPVKARSFKNIKQ